VPVYFVARLAKQHGVTVCQVGEEATSCSAATRSGTGFSGSPGGTGPSRCCRGRCGAWHPVCCASLEALRPPVRVSASRRGGETIFWSGAEAFFERQKAELLTPWVRQRLGTLSSHEVVMEHRRRFLERAPFPDDLTWMGYMDLKLRLPELLLMRVIR